MPRVAVIIPAYNAEAYIGEALNSIRDQTLRDVEVLLIDDGSTDGTIRAALRFSDSLDLTIIEQSNAGPAAARNVGIRRTLSRYCAFLDADDVMLPDRLAVQSARLNADSELGLVYSDLMTFNQGGVIHSTRRAFSVLHEGRVLNQLLLDNFITTSTVMAPTEHLLSAGPFDETRRVSEDFELWLRMAARWKIGYIDRPLVRYRRRTGSLSDDKVAAGLSGLNVVEAFWALHPEYRRNNLRLFHQSLARHLSVVGAAALKQGKVSTASEYLIRSLRHDPGNASSWKWLIKTLLAPAHRLAGRSSGNGI